MAKDTAAAAPRAPRGIKQVAAGFLDALASIAPGEQAIVAKGALQKIRETLAAAREKAKAASAREKAKAATARQKDAARAKRAAGTKPAANAPKRGTISKGVVINDASAPGKPVKAARQARAPRAAAADIAPAAEVTAA